MHLPSPSSQAPGPTGVVLAADRFTSPEPLGHGPNGTVYRAFDRQLARTVAVKTLPHSLPPDGETAAALRRLSHVFHEHVAPIFELNLGGPTPFLVRELANGPTFSEAFRHALLDDDGPAAADLLIQVLDGLATLHRHGLTHGHLTDANVRWDRGRIVLLDAGLVTSSRRQDLKQVKTLLEEILPGLETGHGGFKPLLALEGDEISLDQSMRRFLSRFRGRRLASPLVLDRPFVGRDGELGRLRSALARTRGGQPGALYVDGGAGLGVSALLARFHRLVLEGHPDAVVLAASCRRPPSPYGMLTTLMAELVDHLLRLPAAEVDVVLPGKPRELARFFPQLLRLRGVVHSPESKPEARDDGAEDGAGAAGESQTRADRALRQLMERIAERRPLVLILDEAHRADGASLDMLRRVLKPPDPPPFLLVVGVGAHLEKNPHLESLFLPAPEESSSFISERISLPPLDRRESLWMARSTLGEAASPGRSEAVAEAAEGKPAWISRLVDDLLDRLDDAGELTEGREEEPSVDRRGTVARRLDKIPADSRLLLEVLAVAERPLDRAVAMEASELDSEHFSKALEPLYEEDLARAYEGTSSHLATTDEMVARAVVELAADLCPARAQLAGALARTGGEPDELARLWADAGDGEQARRAAVAGAERALDDGRFEQAVELLSLAIEKSPPSHEGLSALHRRLAQANDRLGDYGRSAASYLEAAEGEGKDVADLRRRAADRLLVNGERERGLEVLQPLLAGSGLEPLTQATPPSPFSARRLYTRLRLALSRSEPKPRRRKTYDPKRLMAVDLCWTLCRGFRTVRPGRGSALSSEHLMLAKRCGEPYRLARALALEIGFQAYGGRRRRQRIERLARQAISLARQLDDHHALGLAEVMTGEAWVLLGEWRRALAALDRGVRTLETECPEAWWERRRALYLQLRCLAMMGRLTEVGHLLRQSGRCSAIRRAPFLRRQVDERFGWLIELAEDRPEKALQWLDDEPRSSSSPSDSYWRLYSRVEVATYRGDVYHAWHELEQQWPAVIDPQLSRIQFLRIEAWHWRARTALAALVQRPEGADAPQLSLAVEKAIDVLEAIKAPWAAAAALLALAGLESLRGRRYESGEALQRAETRLDQLDFTLYHHAARRQRARLMPSAVGPERMARADQHMAELGVVNAERMADFLVPGQWDRFSRDDPTSPRWG